ncbi:Transcriptional regulator MET31 [Mycena venus]|uniref:Transcriptional regulator MET31 n=1 Tax=Mycena venus TaxID=2733690 RepID=A0A8H7D3W6_9AGAR|nr:Transcriptional regulator MET31 [Mycena venus]
MAMMKYRLNPSSYYASATDSDFSALNMSRNYSYPPPGYSGDNGSPPASGYSPTYEQSSGRPYYSSASNARVGHQYYPPIAPAPPSDRYSSNYRSSAEYSNPSGYPSSQYTDNRGSSYQSSSQPPSGSYPFNTRAASPSSSPPASYHRPSTTHPQPRNFIPTPSEAYASRPPRPSSAMHHSSRAGGPYSSTPHPGAPPSSRAPASRPRSSMSSAPSALSPSGERYICEVCGKDFSRAHDRKRHHETQHAATPVTHKCVYCEKDFSRADSLKRHIQNGCDEAPQ